MQRLCSNFKTLLLKKTGFESRRAVITRFQLLKVWNDEFDPKISRNIAIAITRYINSTNARERETVEFAEEIRRRLLYLHEYNCNVQKITGKYPRSKQLNVLLVRYIELSHEVLYNARNYAPEYEKTVEEDLLRFLENMMYDVCNNFDQPIKTVVDSSTKSILKLVITVRKDYRNDKKLVCNLVDKLLSKMGLLKEVNLAKVKRTSVPVWALLKEPEVQKICRSLCTSDYGTDDSESDCDSNCDLVENPPKKKGQEQQNTPENTPVLRQEQIKKEVDEEPEQASAAKIVTIEIFDDDDENFADGYVMYLHPETKSSRGVSKCPKLQTNQDFFTDTSSNQTRSSASDEKTMNSSNSFNKISGSEVVIDLDGDDEVQLVHPKVQISGPQQEKTPNEDSIIICSDEENDDNIPVDKEEEILNKFSDELLLTPKTEFNNVNVSNLKTVDSAHTLDSKKFEKVEKSKNGDFCGGLVLTTYNIKNLPSENKPTPEPDSLSESLESISSGSLFNDILEVKANDFENFHSLCTTNGLLSEDDCKIICDDLLNLPKPLIEAVKSENDDDDHSDDSKFNNKENDDFVGLHKNNQNHNCGGSGESNKFSGGSTNTFRSYKNEQTRSSIPISNSVQNQTKNNTKEVNNTKFLFEEIEENDTFLAEPNNSQAQNEKEQDETKREKCEESINADQIKEIIGVDPTCVKSTFKIVDEDTIFDINSDYSEVITVDPDQLDEEAPNEAPKHNKEMEEVQTVPQCDSVTEVNPGTSQDSFENTFVNNVDCVEASEVNISYDEVIEIDPDHIEEVVIEQNEECSYEVQVDKKASGDDVTVEESNAGDEKCFNEALAVVDQQENQSTFDGVSLNEEIVDNVEENINEDGGSCQQEIKVVQNEENYDCVEEKTEVCVLQNGVPSEGNTNCLVEETVLENNCVEIPTKNTNEVNIDVKAHDKINSLEVCAKEEEMYASPGRYEETSFAFPAETVVETVVESEHNESFTCGMPQPLSSIAQTVVCSEQNDDNPKMILQSEIIHTNNELIIKPVIQGEMNHFQNNSASDDDSNDSTMLKIDKCSDFSDEDSKKICTTPAKVDEAFPNPTELIALAALAAERPRLYIAEKTNSRGRPKTKPKRTPKKSPRKKTKKEEPPKKPRTRKRSKVSANEDNKRMTRNRTKNCVAKTTTVEAPVGEQIVNKKPVVGGRSNVFDEDTVDMDLTLIRTEPFSNGVEEGVSIHIPEAKTTCRGRNFKFLKEIEEYHLPEPPKDTNTTTEAKEKDTSDDLPEEMTIFESLNLVPVKNLLPNDEQKEIAAEINSKRPKEDEHGVVVEDIEETRKNPEEIELEEDTDGCEDVQIRTDGKNFEGAYQQNNCDSDVSDLDEKFTLRTKAALKSYDKINTESVVVHSEESPNDFAKEKDDDKQNELNEEQENVVEGEEKEVLDSSFEDSAKSTIGDVSEESPLKEDDSKNLEEKDVTETSSIDEELDKLSEETRSIKDNEINVEIDTKETVAALNKELVANEPKVEDVSCEENETKYEVVVIENIESETEVKETNVNTEEVCIEDPNKEPENTNEIEVSGDSVEVGDFDQKLDNEEVENLKETNEEIVESEGSEANEKENLIRVDDENNVEMHYTEVAEKVANHVPCLVQLEQNEIIGEEEEEEEENKEVRSGGDDFSIKLPDISGDCTKVDEIPTTTAEENVDCDKKVDDSNDKKLSPIEISVESDVDDKNTEDLKDLKEASPKICEEVAKNEDDEEEVLKQDTLSEDTQKTHKNKIVIIQDIKIASGVPCLVQFVGDEPVSGAIDEKVAEKEAVVEENLIKSDDNKVEVDTEIGNDNSGAFKEFSKEIGKNEKEVGPKQINSEENEENHKNKIVIIQDIKVDVPSLVQFVGDELGVEKTKKVTTEEFNSRLEPKQEQEGCKTENLETGDSIISTNTQNESKTVETVEVPKENSSTIINENEIVQENQLSYEKFEENLQNNKFAELKSSPKRPEKRKNSSKSSNKDLKRKKRIDVIINNLKRKRARLQKNQMKQRSGDLTITDTSDDSSQDKEKKDIFNFITNQSDSMYDDKHETHENKIEDPNVTDKSDEKEMKTTDVTNEIVDSNVEIKSPEISSEENKHFEDKVLCEKIDKEIEIVREENVSLPESIERLNNLVESSPQSTQNDHNDENSQTGKSTFDKINELVVDSIKDSVKDENFLCELNQDVSQSPSSHLSMISAVDIEISHTEQVIDENGPYASPVDVDYSSLSLLQPNENSPDTLSTNLDSPKVCVGNGEPLNSSETLKKLFGEQILLASGDGLDGLDSSNVHYNNEVWTTIHADPSDHSYNRVGDPLLSGKCEKSELKEVSNCNLMSMKESASGESGGDHVDISPLDIEHIFSFTRQIIDVVDQEPSRSLHDFPVDPAVDYQFPEQDSQLGFSFISDPNQSLVDENNSVKYDYFLKSLDELDCVLHSNANQEMSNNFSLTNSDLKDIDPSFITASCQNFQSTTSAGNKKCAENKNKTKSITMDQLIGNCSKKVITEPIEQYSNSMILEPKAYSSKFKTSPEVTPQKPIKEKLVVKATPIETSKVKDLTSKLENVIPIRRRTIIPVSAHVKKTSPPKPVQEEPKKDSVVVNNAETDKNVAKPEKSPPVVVEPTRIKSPKVEAPKEVKVEEKPSTSQSKPKETNSHKFDIVNLLQKDTNEVHSNKFDDIKLRRRPCANKAIKEGFVEDEIEPLRVPKVKKPETPKSEDEESQTKRLKRKRDEEKQTEPKRVKEDISKAFTESLTSDLGDMIFGKRLRKTTSTTETVPIENNRDSGATYTRRRFFDDDDEENRRRLKENEKPDYEELFERLKREEPVNNLYYNNNNNNNKVKKPETPKTEDDEAQARRLKRKREEEKQNEMRRLKEDVHKAITNSLTTDPGDIIYGKRFKITTSSPETTSSHENNDGGGGGGGSHGRRRFFDDDDDLNRRRPKENEKPDYDALFEKLKREEPLNDIFNHNSKTSTSSSKPRDDDSHSKNHYTNSSSRSSSRSGSSSSSRYTSSSSHPYGRHSEGNGLSSRHSYGDSSRHRSHKMDYKAEYKPDYKTDYKIESRHSNGYQGSGTYPRSTDSSSYRYNPNNKYYTGFYGVPVSFLRQSLSKKSSAKSLKSSSSSHQTSYLKSLDPFLPEPKVSFNTPPSQNHSGTEMKRT